MAAVVLGPVLAVMAMWFLTKEQAQMASAVILGLTGAAGVLGSGYAVLAPEPFLLPTDIFFTMVATFDKFSAMFFFPFALVLLALGVRWYVQRASTDLSMPRVIGVALVFVGVTWAFLSTNILGVIAALTALVCGETCLALRSVKHIACRATGILAIAVGLFILSSGALFNDFATLAYIAAELDAARLAGAFGAVLLGVAALSGTWPFTRMLSRQVSSMDSEAERAFVRSAFTIIPLYLFIRLILFILPPLTVWFAVPVSVVGVLTILSSTHVASKYRAFQETSFIFGAGISFFMMSGAMAFQALAMYEAMNVALFATILSVIAVVLAGSAEEHMPKEHALARVASAVASLGLPPSLMFVSIWMFASALVTVLGALPQPLALWFVVGLLFLLGAMVRRGYDAVAQLRSIFSDGQVRITEGRNLSFLLLALVATLGALFVPFALAAIGAGPLTLGAETWNGAVVAGDGLLRLGALLAGIVGLSALFWVFRDKTTTPALVVEYAEETEPTERAEPRATVFFREMRKVFVQHTVTPTLEKMQKFHAWHDTHASKPVSPAFGLMLLTVILTLAIAL